MTKELKGIIPALATPFTADGAVDYDSYANLVQTLVNGGCQGVFLFAIAGEYYKLAEEEEKRLLKITIDTCQKLGGKSIVSVTKHATEIAVRTARDYEDSGADYLVVLPPFFLKPGASDIVEHLRKVAAAVKIPVIVQYAPEQTGVSIPPNILANLANEVENIQYFKIECKPPGSYIKKMMEITNNRARIIIGNAGFQMIEGFDRGAVGVMPGSSMFDVYLKTYQALLNGQREKALRINSDLNAILNHIRQNVEMIICYEKKILKRRGIIATDYCRAPTFTTDQVYDNLFDTYYEVISKHFDY